MIKLCVSTAFYPPHIGGVERYVSELTDNMLEYSTQSVSEISTNGLNIIIVTSNINKNNNKEIKNNKTIFYIPVFKFLSERFPIPKPTPVLFKLLGAIKKENPDVYIINMRVYLISILVALIGKLKKKPLILIEHLSGLPSLGNKLLDFIWRIYNQIITLLMKKLVNKFYGVSKAVVEHLETFKIKSDGIIYNGISDKSFKNNLTNYRRIYNLNSDDIVVVYAGRLIEEKGVITLINSFKQISEIINTRKLHLFIAGEGSLDEVISKLVANNKNISMLGRLTHSEVHNLLNQTDIVVIPSKYPEGLPTLILESGLNECAVISTPMGGTKEIISSTDLGIIIETGSENEIKDAIIHLIHDEDYRRKIAFNLKNKVLNEFNWKDISLKLIKEIEKIIA